MIKCISKCITESITILLLILFLILPTSAIADDYIITQGSSGITQEEFDARISKIPVRDRLPFLADGGRVEKILRQLIMQRKLADIARASGLDKDPQIALRLKLALDNELANVMLDSVEEKKSNSADFELMAHEYYLTHKQQFQSSESVDIAHILIDNKSRTDEAAAALSQNLYKELVASPDKFDAYVLKYSDDVGSKYKGGRYLDVRRGKMVKPFENAAFALDKPGAISRPVKTEFGYHIIRLDAKKPPHQLSFQELKAELISKQRDNYMQAARNEYISKVNTAEPLVIPDCAVEKMMARNFNDPAVTESYQNCLAKIGK